jgi:2-hydroxychromene-2-carboxylate isomerase|tara:strand:- start:297 stop:887 length:591 start_codon:yes stop_codon:yes gene_type:complete
LEKSIEFYFTVISSYSYLAAPRVAEVVKRTGALIIFKPIDIMKVFVASGTTPPAKQPDTRKAYREVDLNRVARAHSMFINIKPAFWPAPQDLASGIIIAAQEAGADPMPLTQAILGAVWAEDKNIADESTLIDIAQMCGFDGIELLAQAKTESVKSTFDANTEEASNKGIFGSPSFIVKGELYWGQDRLDYLEAAL